MYHFVGRHFCVGGRPRAARVRRQQRAAWCASILGLVSLAAAAETTKLTVLHSFNLTDGHLPRCRLVEGPDGKFYGTTIYGGTFEYGTVFSITPSGTLTTLHNFSSANDPQEDGSSPNGLILEPSGDLLGTTQRGGAGGLGTVFRITPAGDLTPLATFDGNLGGQPFAPLVRGSDGAYYGTTISGVGPGTVFRIGADGAFTSIVQLPFDGLQGADIRASVTEGPDGRFYGTTYVGGAASGGTIFAVSPQGALESLHSFQYAGDPLGNNPAAELLLASDGAFYGTAYWGGAGCGTIFRMTASGSLTVLHAFNCSQEAGGPAGLIEADDGKFYGTASFSSNAAIHGSIYRIASDGTYETLHFFDRTDGRSPAGGVVQGSDGNFYGTTEDGGDFGYGTVFKLTISPPAADGLVATAGNAQVSLSWNAARRATSYAVYASTTAGAPTGTPAKTGVSGTSTQITGLTNGTQYYFHVVAVNEAGDGPPSDAATATPVAPPSSGGGGATSPWYLVLLAIAAGGCGFGRFRASRR